METHAHLGALLLGSIQSSWKKMDPLEVLICKGLLPVHVLQALGKPESVCATAQVQGAKLRSRSFTGGCKVREVGGVAFHLIGRHRSYEFTWLLSPSPTWARAPAPMRATVGVSLLDPEQAWPCFPLVSLYHPSQRPKASSAPERPGIVPQSSSQRTRPVRDRGPFRTGPGLRSVNPFLTEAAGMGLQER